MKNLKKFVVVVPMPLSRAYVSISITRNNHKFDIYFLIINFYCSYFSCSIHSFLVGCVILFMKWNSSFSFFNEFFSLLSNVSFLHGKWKMIWILLFSPLGLRKFSNFLRSLIRKASIRENLKLCQISCQYNFL